MQSKHLKLMGRAANVRKRLDILVLRADDVLAIPQN